jgi:hypothetical protein
MMGTWNVNGLPSSVIMVPSNVIMEPWNVILGPWNVNRGCGMLFGDL